MRVQQSHLGTAPKVCVFLLHQGCPPVGDKLPVYLRRLFADALPLPTAVRPHAAALLGTLRAAPVRTQLQQIAPEACLGQHAPAQARALQEALTARGYQAHVLLAQRYGAPDVRDALLEARAHAADAQWVIVPLFPQYAFDTTRLCVTDLYKRLSPAEKPRTSIVEAYPDNAGVLDAMAVGIETTLVSLTADVRREVHMVFAARAIGERVATLGDPYPRQVEQTVAGLLARVKKPPRHTLAFQRSIPYLPPRIPWARSLAPSLQQTLQHLGAAGQKEVLVVPLSAVAEDFHTLHDLDVTMRAVALAAGIRGFHRVPTVSAQPAFIQALADLVQTHVPLTDHADDHDAPLATASSSEAITATEAAAHA